MNRGDILLSPRHEMPGGEADKYLIVLNPPSASKPFLAVPTTKQPRGRLASHGCNAFDGYFFISAGTDWFPLPTWVLFRFIAEYDGLRVLQEIQKGNLKPHGKIKDELMNAIINCIKAGFDISQYHKQLISN